MQHRGAVCGGRQGPASSSHPIFRTEVLQEDAHHPFLIDLHPGPPLVSSFTLGFYIQISHLALLCKSPPTLTGAGYQQGPPLELI